ncbi:NUDIX hydrolase [Streptomyces sp. NPDC088354]|uniref:NUDIX hydrolase n=1 Tax=unclassified Streptomyces TaxID=2593676 RepID=UPI0029BD914F|nr:NUDIX domain-containing protein [Streptomyces sp. MI02-7b]MDX3078482.1 NUDIX domain-containing protein [Streptomyces sp. MI02-7b]
MADRQGEDDFLAAYDPRAFDPIAVTVDVVALTLRQGALHVLLVRRGAQPFEGAWALPGGFVRAGRESLDRAAARELAEETGLDEEHGLGRVHLEQLGSYGAPARDPRMHVVSVAYLAFAPDLPEARAGSDAAAAEWVPVASLALEGNPDAVPPRPMEQDRPAGIHGGGPGRRSAEPVPSTAGTALAFDHGTILADGLERARSKIEYSPLATAFLGEEFTVTELRSVYEAVWGRSLHAGNFHRKILSVPGFVESTGATATRGGSRGGPRARLYRAGDARLLHPALLRPDREESVR